MEYPRPITAINIIEVTTYCDLRCPYCPSPKLEQLRGQPKQHMTMAMFERALDWAEAFPLRDGLSLSGIGEPLMHPDIVSLLARVRTRLPTQAIMFSTNGVKLTDELCAEMAPYQPNIFISIHRPEKAGPAVAVARKHGLFVGLNPAPVLSPTDWSGQVKWMNDCKSARCTYLLDGWAMILVDGRITTCCMDASAKGVIGHIDNPFESVTAPGTGLRPFEFCARCHARPEDSDV